MAQQGQPDDPFGELVAHNELVRARRARRRRMWRGVALVVLGVLFLAGVGLIGYGIAQKTTSHGTVATKPPPPPPPPPSTTAPAVGSTTAPATTTTTARPPRVVFVVHATRGDSWLELRTGSATGHVVYSGILRQGSTTTARGRVVWVRFGSAANLDLELNGKPIHGVTGTLDATVTPSGLQ